MLFEKLGFRYFGPIDGHDVALLIKTLNDLHNIRGPLLLHIVTSKGKGYEPAEKNPSKFHGVGKFDKITGEAAPKAPSLPAYTKVFGDTMVELGEKNERGDRHHCRHGGRYRTRGVQRDNSLSGFLMSVSPRNTPALSPPDLPPTAACRT